MKKLIMICITAAVMMAPLAAYARPVRVIVGPGFGWGGWGWDHPDLGPYPYGYFNFAPETGPVKFDTRLQDAEGQICCAYAPAVGKLQTIPLPPTSHSI